MRYKIVTLYGFLETYVQGFNHEGDSQLTDDVPYVDAITSNPCTM